LKITKREGKKANGEPYLFYVGNFLDDESNVCNLKIGKIIQDNEKELSNLLKLNNQPVYVDVALYPSGFKLNGTIVKIDKK
jgi:hypothetical protein